MASKYEVIGNDLYITDTSSGIIEFQKPAKECRFDNDLLKMGSIGIIFPLTALSPIDTGFESALANSQDQDDVPFTEETFRTFCSDNLGKSSGGTTPILTPTTFGFIDYNDATGDTSIVSDTWTSVPNDGEGAFTNKTYAPDGISELMDVSTGKIDTSELNLGDVLFIRNDYTITPNTNNASLEFRYTLGSGGGAYTLETTKGRLDKGSGIPYRFSLTTDEIYMGDTNTVQNPIGLEVKLSANGTLSNAGTVITALIK